MSNRGKQVAVLVALVAAGGLFLGGWSVREAVLSGHGDWRATIGTLASWTGDAGKFVLGALIGALAAWIVARANRDEARRARFADRTVELSAEVMKATFDRLVEIGVQLRARAAADDNGIAIPPVRTDAAMELALFELDLVVNDRRPAVIGERLRKEVSATVNEFSAHWPADYLDQDHAKRVDATRVQAFDTAALRASALVQEFAQSVRAELGRTPFPNNTIDQTTSAGRTDQDPL